MKLSIKEAIITAIITIGIANKTLPISPPIIISGTKAAMVVNDAATTGANILCAPPSAACKGGSPFSKWESASSPTTIASSTIIPNAIINANRLTILILPPIRYITIKVAKKETGMPTATQKATRPFINKYKIKITRTNPPRPLVSNKLIR